MSKITFEDKEAIRQSDLPSKNVVSASDLNEIKNSVNALYDNPESVYNSTVSNVTSDDIKAIGTSPKLILASGGAGIYRDGYAIVEYTFDTSAYTNTKGNYLIISDGVNFIELFNLNAVKENMVAIVSLRGSRLGINQALYLTTGSGENPMFGIGTIKVKLFTKDIIFGS